MPIDSLCAGCGRKLRVADEHAGKRAKCPSCGHQYVVPEASTPAEPRIGPIAPAFGAANLGAPAWRPPEGVGQTFQPQATTIPTAGPLGASSAYGVPGASVPGDTRWRVRLPDGREYGPVSRMELDQWQAQGRVGPDCQLQPEGQTTWSPATAIYPALAGALALASGAAPFGQQPGAGPGLGPRPNPFADNPASPSFGNPYASPGAGGYFPRLEPNRGVLVLVLSIVSFFLCCPALSIGAVIVGWLDLNEIAAGRMSAEGKGMVIAGVIISGVQLAMTVLGFLLALVNG